MQHPRVATRSGRLRGTREGGVAVFRGIPFAAPPVGARRWQPPEPPDPWPGERDASRFGPASPQGSRPIGRLLGIDPEDTSEDCLYLNVWTPEADGRRRPVLFWIHGGAFTIGAGSQPLYNGACLARRGDVVVVTINYRLGALGFLRGREAMGDALPTSGNLGLLDQVAALEWVRDEIAGFGGDPENVTIFGESAGGGSVAALLALPLARGLFHRAIVQSGSPRFVLSREEACGVATSLLAALGLRADESRAILDLPAAKLVEAQQPLALEFGASLGMPLQPVVDGEILPRSPLESIRDGSAARVPLLVGTTRDESKLFSLLDPAAKRLDEERLLRRCATRLARTVAAPGDHARRIVEQYRAVRQARGAPVDPRELWDAIETDRVFRVPSMRMAEAHAGHEPCTYAYLFSWPSPAMGGALGACHALELPFVFGGLDDPALKPLIGDGPEARTLSDRMQDAWIMFARGADPSHDGLGEWPAYEGVRRATMDLGASCRVTEAPLEQERRIWDSLL